MSTNLLLGFLIGASFSAWLYSKLMRSTGGNTKSALIVAGSLGVLTMLLMTFLLGAFLPK